MDINKAQTLARKVMDDANLHHIPFRLDGGKRRLGATKFYGFKGGPFMVKEITLSRHYAALLREDEVREVMIHECAHAIAGHEENHGPKFRTVVRSLGGTATGPCMTPSAKPESAWIGTCSKGHTTEMYRAPQVVRSCGKCSPRFKLENIYTWAKNGKPVAMANMPKKFQTQLSYLQLRKSL